MMKKNILIIAISLSWTWMAQAQFWGVNEPIKMGGTVNSDAEESMPVFSKDSSILYFTRTNSDLSKYGTYDQDIWYSVKNKDGLYVDCQPLKGLNNNFKNTVFGINSTGSRIYLVDSYEGKKDMRKGCAFSEKKGETWTLPLHIEIPTLDIDGDFYGFHVNSNETIMIISYKGANSIGEEDLYFSKKENNTWSAPISLGNAINTTGFEISPFLSNNLDTLYFSSNGLGGLGDADIFYSVKLDNSYTNWSTPKNLGDKINSPKFDAYFSSFGENMYWSSNRDGEKSDIYTTTVLEAPKLYAKAIGTDVTSYKGTDGKIDLIPEGGVEPYSFKWSNGAIIEDPMNLPKGEYTVMITDAIGQAVEVTTSINEPILAVNSEIGKIIKLNTIYFDLGKWNIRSDAKIELDKIVVILNENPKMVVELGSHTDCRNSISFNKGLSEKRAAASVNYIKQRISHPNRIKGKGYGESKLISDCPCEDKVISTCSEEQHQLNRRTEFVIISMN